MSRKPCKAGVIGQKISSLLVLSLFLFSLTMSGMVQSIMAADRQSGADTSSLEDLEKRQEQLKYLHDQTEKVEIGQTLAAKINLLPAPPQTYKDPVTDMEFILVKGGCFQMGDVSQGKASPEKCVNDFYLGKYEVTNIQWYKVMDQMPTARYLIGGRDYPVTKVNVNNIDEYAAVLGKKSGNFYRLPTEVEWEYACAEGQRKTKYAGTDSDSKVYEYACCEQGIFTGRHSDTIGRKKPNAFGLYDMSGNVAEWTESPHIEGDSPDGAQILRGGYYGSGIDFFECTTRSYAPDNATGKNIGFRLVRVIPGPYGGVVRGVYDKDNPEIFRGNYSQASFHKLLTNLFEALTEKVGSINITELANYYAGPVKTAIASHGGSYIQKLRINDKKVDVFVLSLAIGKKSGSINKYQVHGGVFLDDNLLKTATMTLK